MTEVERVRRLETRPVELSAPDLEQLLVEWLGEALYLFDARGFVAASGRLRIRQRSSGGLELRGEMAGERHDPERHPLKVLVKAITYHRLEVGPTRAGWRARVIFDI